MELRTTVTPEVSCPWCGKHLDRATSADPENPRATPEPNDITLCIACASPLIFTETLSLRKATPDEEKEFGADHAYQRARQAVLALDRSWR